jgi:hypothetical protein
MASIQKNIVFLLSVLLLLQSDAFSMIKDDKEGFLSWLFKRKATDSKPKTSELNKKQNLDDWVILEDEPSEEPFLDDSSQSKNPKKVFEMKPMIHLDNENDKDLTTWEIIRDTQSEKYDKDSLIYSNDPVKINNHKIQKIIEIFENF